MRDMTAAVRKSGHLVSVRVNRSSELRRGE